MPIVAVAGYLSIDEIVVEGEAHREVPGGAALYAALGARHAGARPHLFATIGADYPPAWLAALAGLGIDVSAVRQVAGATRRARLTYRGDDRCRSAQTVDDAWRERTLALIPPLAAGARFDAAVVTAMPAISVAAQIAVAGAPVIADSSEYFAACERQAILALLPRLALFAPSIQETRLLCPDLDDDAALAELASRCRRIVQKRGQAGMVLGEAGAEPIGIAPVAAKLVDPTGAGDAATGAMGAAVAARLGSAAMLEAGVAAAARALSDLGPRGLGLSF
jgi:ribokinase